MKRRTFIKIGLGTTALAAVPFQACTGVEPEDGRPEIMHLDFSACPHRNAQRFEYHKSYYCPRAAIMDQPSITRIGAWGVTVHGATLYLSRGIYPGNSCFSAALAECVKVFFT